MGLFDFFKRKTPEPKFKGNVFDYHEDDFCLIELLPKENMAEIDNDLQSIDDISEYHSSSNGFTKIHILNEKKVKTVDRNIPLSDIDAILKSSTFTRFDTVTTGYGSMQFECEDSVAFGIRGCAIIYERIRNRVERIWLNYYPAWADDNNRSEMEKCLTEICNTWDLVLVDWRQGIVVDPAYDLSIRKYLIGHNDE